MDYDFYSLDDVRLWMISVSKNKVHDESKVYDCPRCIYVAHCVEPLLRAGFQLATAHYGMYKPCPKHADQYVTYEWVLGLDPKVVQGFLLRDLGGVFTLSSLKDLANVRR